MALQGNLEDLPLLDIIQIVSFSKKTGYLSIEMEGGDGAIVFREGLVVSAFTADSPPADRRLGSLPPEAREKAVRGRIGFALEHLARLREGGFGFELTDDVPGAVGGRDIRLETLARGINPQEMLLDLAQGLDDDRTQSAAAVEASFAAPIVPGEALSSEIEALAGEPPDVPAAEAGPPLTGRQQWETPPVERPGTDTRPLPKVVLPGAPAGPLDEGKPPAATGQALCRGQALYRGQAGTHRSSGGRRGGRAPHPRPAVPRGRLPGRRGGGPGGGGEGGLEGRGFGGPLRSRHRSRHAGLGRGLVPRGLRGGEAPLEDEPPPARADDDGEPQPVAPPARAADGCPVLRLQADPQQAQHAAVRGRPLGLRGEAGGRRAAATGRGRGGAPRPAVQEEGGRGARPGRGGARRGRGAALRVPEAAAGGAPAGRRRQRDHRPRDEGGPGVLREGGPLRGEERGGARPRRLRARPPRGDPQPARAPDHDPARRGLGLPRRGRGAAGLLRRRPRRTAGSATSWAASAASSRRASSSCRS